MRRRLRIQDPDIIFHVTNRTQEAKYLFVPDDELNAIVMRWLRCAVRIFGIELYVPCVVASRVASRTAPFRRSGGSARVSRGVCYLERCDSLPEFLPTAF